MEYELGPMEQLVAPPFRGGAVARFAVQRITAVTGALSVPGPEGRVRPANGEVVVAAGGPRRTSPVTPEGRFWLDGIPPGRHRAEVAWRQGVCAVDLEVGPSAGAVVDLGELECRPEPDLRASR